MSYQFVIRLFKMIEKVILFKKLILILAFILIFIVYLLYKLKNNHQSFNRLGINDYQIKNLDNFNKSTLILNHMLNESTGFYYSTIISIYFSLNITKHSNKDYKLWIQNMLISIDGPLVVFTDYNTKDYIKKYRYAKPTIIYIYDNVWQLMRELEVYRNKTQFFYINKYFFDQQSKDPEKSIQNPNLYAIWNLKVFLTNRIARENPFKTKFFIFTDMGSWRDAVISHWPNETFIQQVNNFINDRILLSQINQNVEKFKPENDLIQGGFFGGSQKALDYFYEIYYNLHDERLKNGYFVGKEQTTLNILAFQTHPSKVSLLKSFDYKKCFKYLEWDRWFFYQIYFSSLMDKYFDCNKIELIEN